MSPRRRCTKCAAMARRSALCCVAAELLRQVGELRAQQAEQRAERLFLAAVRRGRHEDHVAARAGRRASRLSARARTSL